MRGLRMRGGGGGSETFARRFGKEGAKEGSASLPCQDGLNNASMRSLTEQIKATEREVRRLNGLAETGLVLAIQTISTIGDLTGDTASALLFRRQLVSEVSALISPGVPVALPRISVVRSTPSPDAACARGGEGWRRSVPPVRRVGGLMTKLPPIKRDDVGGLERKHALLLDSKMKHERALECLRVFLEEGTDFLEQSAASDMDWFADWLYA